MEDLQWKKKSDKWFKYAMLFFIRFAEILTSSIIPSVIGLIILLITPEERVIQVMGFVSLMVFLLFNCIFWIKYVRHRPGRKEFYILNGLVYALYASISFVLYRVSEVLLYTIIFSDLRGFEIFGFGTFASLLNSHIIMIVAMVICEVTARAYYLKKYRDMIKNGAEVPEINAEKAVPEKGNSEIELLSIDEINIELEREILEAAAMIQSETEQVSDKNWDSEMVQGETGKIIEATPFDPDNDIEDSDYVSEAYAREEMSVTMKYDVDSLWNEEIYQNRETAEEYDDEVYKPEMFEDYEDALWSPLMHKGNGESDSEDVYMLDEFVYDDEADEDDDDERLFNVDVDYDDEPEEYMPNSYEDYDSDRLWDNFEQGNQKNGAN